MTAVFPFGDLPIIDSKVNVTIRALRLIAARARIDRQRNAASSGRVIHINNVADDVVQLLGRVDPSANCEIAYPKLERIASRNFDVRLLAVELTALDDDAMIDAVITVAR
jgi:hypothetical protein